MSHSNAFVRFMSETYATDELQDIATRGCESGCAGGMIYYSETIALFDEYRDELFEIISNYQNETGTPDELPQYINENAGTFATFANAMVWMAAEIAAFELTAGE